jgi:hypothetical protein
MEILRTLILAALAVAFSLPSYAYALYEPAAFPGASRNSTAFLLDWTTASVERTGCLACHSDPHLVEAVGKKVVRLAVDAAALDRSAHGDRLCTDCHVGFGRHDAHPNVPTPASWKTVAQMACGNCHKKEFADWAKSYHSTTPTSPVPMSVGRASSSAAGMAKPLCGDCHSAHSIPAKSDVAAKASFRASAATMCARCHKDSAASYVDYYHGAAYWKGAPDAPACWTCHNAHFVMPSKDARSSTNQANLTATCSRCHKHVGAGYTDYAKLVHAQKAAYSGNPIVNVVGRVTQAAGRVLGSVLARR